MLIPRAREIRGEMWGIQKTINMRETFQEKKGLGRYNPKETPIKY